LDEIENPLKGMDDDFDISLETIRVSVGRLQPKLSGVRRMLRLLPL